MHGGPKAGRGGVRRQAGESLVDKSPEINEKLSMKTKNKNTHGVKKTQKDV